MLYNFEVREVMFVYMLKRTAAKEAIPGWWMSGRSVLTGLTSDIVVDNDDDDDDNVAWTATWAWLMEANGLHRLNTIIKLCSHFGSYNYITNVLRIDSGRERVFFQLVSSGLWRRFGRNVEWNVVLDWRTTRRALWSVHYILGWFSNRTETSVDDGKARGKDWTRFLVTNCRSAIGQASCLICARHHQLTFPFCC